MGRMIGIDLGTTNSCVAVVEEGKVTVVHNQEGNLTTPSIIAFTPEGKELSGTTAKRQAVTNPQRTVYGIKRLLGRKFDTDAIASFSKMVPFTIEAAENGDACVAVDGRQYRPEEIAGRLLEMLKGIAEEYLGEEVTEAVITVPAFFDASQRQATKDAAMLAGLRVDRILNEPTAAALAYGIKQTAEKCIAVFDLGGGTFDITIYDLADDTFEVLATAGDTFLGGEDFDQRLMQHMIETFREETGVDVGGDPTALQRLKEAAETAKHELSVALSADIALPFLATRDQEPVHFELEGFARTKLEKLVSEEIGRLAAPCEIALAEAGVSRDEVDEVLLVGGMTRMPAVQQFAEDLFGKKPAQGIHPELAVAMGAAIQGSMLGRGRSLTGDAVLLDVLPHSVGIKVKDGRFRRLIERNTRIPCREKRVFTPVQADQDFVVIEVYQGEADLVRQNKHLGRFLLDGLPRGAEPSFVEVSFTVDADGLLDVSATEMQTGKEASIQIRPSSGIDRKELRRLARARGDRSTTV